MNDDKFPYLGFSMEGLEMTAIHPLSGAIFWYNLSQSCSRCGSHYWIMQDQTQEEAHPVEACDLEVVRGIMEV